MIENLHMRKFMIFPCANERFETYYDVIEYFVAVNAAHFVSNAVK